MSRTTPAEKLALAKADLASDHPMVLMARRHFEQDPTLYEAFEDATLKLLDQGYERFSHWMVANYVRYNTMSQYRGPLQGGDQDGGFKVPNGIIGVWARQFIVTYPEHADVFTLKALGAETKGEDHEL